MSLYTISALILSEIQLCLVDNTCKYDYFVSMGEPPADCSSISTYYLGSNIIDKNANPCIKTRIDKFEVMITRCCMEQNPNFDPVVEDRNAKCFLDDYEIILDCLVCNINDALAQYNINCKLNNVRGSGTDRAPMGGCYSGSINIEIERFIGCCP